MHSRQRSIRKPAVDHPAGRPLPPGQHAARRWPVLHQGDVPPFDPATWDFRVFGLVASPLRFGWDEMSALPAVEQPGDLHCVTRWSVIDTGWSGIPAGRLIGLAGPLPEARFAILHGEGGYTANVPLAALVDSTAILATGANGEPLSPEHGFPLRAVLPALYAWKSVKWLRAIELVAADRPGFWESFGYSNSADPWREQRFAEDDDRT
ncbi:MAG: sulfite oxidase-like oxidoreductase [Chloroflexota bacterium]